ETSNTTARTGRRDAARFITRTSTSFLPLAISEGKNLEYYPTEYGMPPEAWLPECFPPFLTRPSRTLKRIRYHCDGFLCPITGVWIFIHYPYNFWLCKE